VQADRGFPALPSSMVRATLVAVALAAAAAGCPSHPPPDEPHTYAGAPDAAPADNPPTDAPAFGGCPDPTGPATVSRTELTAFLDGTLQALLGRVRISPVLDRQGPGARFLGYRIVAIDPELRCAVFGLREGDVLVAVNGRSIERPDETLDLYESLYEATEVRLTLLRGGIEQEVAVTIADDPVRIDNEGVSPAVP
jgi:hypothetical protein